MNKRFSTLVAAFAAIATVSYAQIGDKYVHLKTSSTYLTWDKASLADSVTLGSKVLLRRIWTLLCGKPIWFVSICRVMTLSTH